ncbi:TPA: GNAT family N-acetyltransferase [Vibrio parahaemolyticus]|nr:GNAT family N-acetyltransferase [Vibrio parahaemolyticus]HCH1634728.1 GNAT family N-acetyltransferase [Vibrio parahaemolyticus]
MEVSVSKVDASDRHVLENLYQYYVYSLSKVADIEVSENGLFEFSRKPFILYWLEPSHVPYFIKVGSNLAGFALVRCYPANKERWDMEQFFVLSKYNGQGVGRKVFRKIAENHGGKWQIRILKTNQSAFQFWRSTVVGLTKQEPNITSSLDVDLEMDFIKFEFVG